MCLNCHVVAVEIEIRDLDALEAACKRLGWTLHRHRNHKWNQFWVDDSPTPQHLFANPAEYHHVIHLSKHDRQTYMTGMLNASKHAINVPGREWEIGLVQQADGHYRLTYDWYADRHKGQLNFNPLLQAYAVELETAKAKQLRYSCQESFCQDGSIQLRLTQWS